MERADRTTEIRPPPSGALDKIVIPEGYDELAAETAVEDALIQTLAQAWYEMSRAHDVIAPIPEMSTLFADVSLARPYEAAETVLVNILTEIIEQVDRFSPWYTKPASAYGLAAQRCRGTAVRQWQLTEAGCRKWWHLLDKLARVIDKNRSLIEAMLLVDRLMTTDKPDDPRVAIRCNCQPPRIIHVRQSILNQSPIICSACKSPFTPVEV